MSCDHSTKVVAGASIRDEVASHLVCIKENFLSAVINLDLEFFTFVKY
jgi:hypothetical protein